MLRSLIRVIGVTFLLLLCVTLSCAPIQKKTREIRADQVRQFTLHIDSQFNALEKNIVIDSFIEWERDTHGIVKFGVSPVVWNSSSDDTEYSVDDDSGCTVDVYVAYIDSNYKPLKEMERGPGGGKGNTLGYTQHQCDVKFVAFVMDRINKIKDPTLLRNVGVHEAGHLIGLSHIPVPEDSIMFPSMDYASKCPTKLDMKQLCLLYGCDWRQMLYCGN